MAKNQNQNPKRTKSGTNVQHVRKQNQQAAQGQTEGVGQVQYETEFASETDAQEVKKRNQKAEQNKQ